MPSVVLVAISKAPGAFALLCRLDDEIWSVDVRALNRAAPKVHDANRNE